MGKVLSSCSEPPKPQQRTVTFLANSVPDDKKYKAIDPDSIRLCDVTAFKRERNMYQFTMTVRNQNSDIQQIVPVLNEMVHCIGAQNYELEINTQMIVDIFDKKVESTLMSATNPRTARQFSMKIVPFKSYTSSRFKSALHQVHLNKAFGFKSYTTVKLMDYFVYGVNPDQQSFVMLFDKCSTSLANVAQYRKQANTPWVLKQKLKIISQIFESYESIYNKKIIHRDLRPSNVFYVESVGKFLIGNFSRARRIEKQIPNDLKSVCGVPDFSCQEIQHLAFEGEKIGYYDGIRQDYAGLKSILNIIQTCQFYNKNPKVQNQQIFNISQMLSNAVDFKLIMAEINKAITKNSVNLSGEIGDRQIASSCQFLLAHTHKALIERYMFEAYGYLGYYKNYSERAHRMISQNNQSGKESQNAYILAKMGDFYEQNGAGGFQYYYNAFVLFIARADNQLRYGYPDRADFELEQAQQTYFKFNRSIESDVPRIEAKRVESLIELANGNHDSARNMINENLVAAAKSNIPVQKQCKILLAYGRIYGQQSKLPEIIPMMDEAIKKLATGLSICDNSATFDSPSQCRIIKSKFLRQLGALYSRKIRVHIYMDKQKQIQNQMQIKAQSQTYLKSALQIQQREHVDDLQIADTAEELGSFYYFDRNFYEAKKYLEVAKIRLSHMKQYVNPNRQLMVLYLLGSSNYYLKEYNEAKMTYLTCLASLQKFPKTQANQVLNYNIEGNLGLSMLKMNNKAGKQKVESALQKLKQIKGENSFDYASLYNNYIVVDDS